MQPNGDLEGMEGVVPISTVVILKRRKKLTKILLCNLEVSLLACLRSFSSGPQGVPWDPIDLPGISSERNPSVSQPKPKRLERIATV